MKSIRKHLLTARTGCGFSSANSSLMMMEARPRVSKRALIVGGVLVACVTFVVLIAEGVLTFGTKTAHTGRLMVEATSVDQQKSKEKADSSLSSSSSSSSTNAARSDDDAGKNSPSSKNGEEPTLKKDEKNDDDAAIETSVSGVESCKSAPDDSVVSTSKCRACGAHDKLHVAECAETGSVEQTVTCLGGKPTKRKHRPCRGSLAEREEERKFTVFEIVNLGLGIAAYLVVLLRRKKLDSALAKKIEQQLASGV